MYIDSRCVFCQQPGAEPLGKIPDGSAHFFIPRPGHRKKVCIISFYRRKYLIFEPESCIIVLKTVKSGSRRSGYAERRF